MKKWCFNCDYGEQGSDCQEPCKEFIKKQCDEETNEVLQQTRPPEGMFPWPRNRQINNWYEPKHEQAIKNKD